MNWRCLLFGHTWGPWSLPMTEVVTETTDYSLNTRTTNSVVQYRTCEPCGRQQRRMAEEQPLEIRIR